MHVCTPPTHLPPIYAPTHAHMLTWAHTHALCALTHTLYTSPAHTHTHLHGNMHILTHSPQPIHTCSHAHGCTLTYLVTYMLMCTNTHTHMCTPTTLAHTCLHTFAHTHGGSIAAALTSGAEESSCFFPNRCSHNKENRKGLGARDRKGKWPAPREPAPAGWTLGGLFGWDSGTDRQMAVGSGGGVPSRASGPWCPSSQQPCRRHSPHFQARN